MYHGFKLLFGGAAHCLWIVYTFCCICVRISTKEMHRKKDCRKGVHLNSVCLYSNMEELVDLNFPKNIKYIKL